MTSNIYLDYKRELRWVAAKRFLQDCTQAAGAGILFVFVLVLASEIDLFFEVLK